MVIVGTGLYVPTCYAAKLPNVPRTDTLLAASMEGQRP